MTMSGEHCCKTSSFPTHLRRTQTRCGDTTSSAAWMSRLCLIKHVKFLESFLVDWIQKNGKARHTVTWQNSLRDLPLSTSIQARRRSLPTYLFLDEGFEFVRVDPIARTLLDHKFRMCRSPYLNYHTHVTTCHCIHSYKCYIQMNGKESFRAFSARSLHLAQSQHPVFRQRERAIDSHNHRITGLTRKLEMESREDEARMWSILCILRFPDADAFYNQGVLLNKMSLA